MLQTPGGGRRAKRTIRDIGWEGNWDASVLTTGLWGAKLQQERAREKRAQADARQTLKEHVQDFAMQLSSSMA